MRALVSSMAGKPRVIALQAAVLLALVGAGVGYAAMRKDVTLTVDGHVTHVASTSGTVADFLKSRHVTVGSRDLVAPAGSTRLADGSGVVVRYARPLTLTVDGRKQTFWTTELSVDGALNALGVRAAGAQMSASRSQPIGRGGLTMWLSTPKRVTLVVGGRKQRLTTTAPTVAMLLSSESVLVNPLDKLSTPPDAALTDGQRIRLTRIERKQRTRQETIRFATVKHKSSSMYAGQTKITKKGRPGARTATYSYLLADGKISRRTLLSAHVLTKPVTEVVKVGTKARPGHGADVGGSADSLNWAALAKCESGGNPKAVNPAGYYGLYQFALSTWHSVGGSGNPIDASSAEQTYRAKLLFKKGGAGQWGCGQHLYD